MRHMTDDLRIKEIKELVAAGAPAPRVPCDESASATVFEARSAIHRILHGMDDRLVVVIGPCSIHDRAPRSSTRSGCRPSANA